MKKRSPPKFFTFAEEALAGKRKGWKALRLFLGPAFIASIAYIDPGNFASNIQSGAEFGYALAWVILTANLMGIFIQLLSAKLGVATGRNLAELCQTYFPRPVSYFLWIQAEIVAIATDLAELIGASLGFYLLFHIPLFESALLAAGITLLLLQLQKKGFRLIEAILVIFVAIIVLSFSLQTFFASPQLSNLFQGFIPQFPGKKSIYLATAILGSTVMPHVIFLHSALTQKRVIGDTQEKKKKLYHFQVADVLIAMGIAGLINLSMLVLAAAVFHEKGLYSIQAIDSAFYALKQYLPYASHWIFGVALLTSGISSSVVGTMAGQVILQGFVPFSIPLWVRRILTILPSLILIRAGINPISAMIFSQVVLSFGIPFALLPLLYFTQKSSLMGPLVNHPLTTLISWVITFFIISLNGYLLTSLF